jgi:hypothetical protein
VLAHAELETYFESRAIEVAKAAWAAWKKSRHVSRVALRLLAFSGKEMTLPPGSLEAPDPNKSKAWANLLSIDERLERAVSEYVYRVSIENHGIKEKNILSMLLPIGFEHSKLDQLLLTSLNQFGEARGIVAHSSMLSRL